MRKPKLSPEQLILNSYLYAKKELCQLDMVDQINYESQQVLMIEKLERKIKRSVKIEATLVLAACASFILMFVFLFILLIRLVC